MSKPVYRGFNDEKGIIGYINPDFSKSVEERILSVHKELTSNPRYQGFDSIVLRNASFVSCSIDNQSTKWTFTVPAILANKSYNLHGGAAATLLDSLTSTALMTVSRPGFVDAGHVSRALDTKYLRPVPVGEVCTVECEVIAAGKKTAMVRGVIKLANGKIAVHCVHDKAVFAAKAKL